MFIIPSLSNALNAAVGFLPGFGANKAFNKSRQKSRKVTRRGWNTHTDQQKSSIKHSFIIICLRLSTPTRAALNDSTWAGEHLQSCDTFGSSSILVLFGETADFKDECYECSVFLSEVARSFARSNYFTAVIWILPVNYFVILRQQSLSSRDNDIMEPLWRGNKTAAVTSGFIQAAAGWRRSNNHLWFLYVLIVCSSTKLRKNKSSLQSWQWSCVLKSFSCFSWIISWAFCLPEITR